MRATLGRAFIQKGVFEWRKFLAQFELSRDNQYSSLDDDRHSGKTVAVAIMPRAALNAKTNPTGISTDCRNKKRSVTGVAFCTEISAIALIQKATMSMVKNLAMSRA
jgi:hypothetical protein